LANCLILRILPRWESLSNGFIITPNLMGLLNDLFYWDFPERDAANTYSWFIGDAYAFAQQQASVGQGRSF